MSSINQKTLDRFLEMAGKRLEGNWVIIGGSVLALLGADYRVTNDIDLAGPPTATQKDSITLMEIAEEIGLPVEAINQAGAFFLSKIPNWQKMLVPCHTGKKATIFRPNATLYLLLKIPRLSESDLSDCLKMIELHREEVELSVLSKRIQKEIEASKTEKAERLRKLRAQLSP